MTWHHQPLTTTTKPPQMTLMAMHHTDGTPPNEDEGRPRNARIRKGLCGSLDDGWVATSPTRWTMPIPSSSTVSTGTPPSVDPPLTRPITLTRGEGRGAAWPTRMTHHQGARGRRGTGVLLSTRGLMTGNDGTRPRLLPHQPHGCQDDYNSHVKTQNTSRYVLTPSSTPSPH